MHDFAKPSSREHVMFLYDNDDTRNEAAINYINDGLRKGQMAIYASVHANDKSHMSKISSKIMDYAENIELGSLLILNLNTFYQRALAGDLEPFKDFKAMLEEIVQERIAGKRNEEVVVVADCADSLSRNEKFDECLYVERWWQGTHSEWMENNLKITVICPHPNSILENNALHKNQISNQHSLTVVAINR